MRPDQRPETILRHREDRLGVPERSSPSKTNDAGQVGIAVSNDQAVGGKVRNRDAPWR